jgi:CHAD domain-containing protein
MTAARDDKWLSGLEADDSIGHAAQCAVENRLQFFWKCVKQAGKSRTPTSSEVHRVRVAARRAMAALETFAPLLPQRRGKWIRKQVKHMRRAAGKVRDDDVLLVQLQNVAPPSHSLATTGEIPLWLAQLEAERALHQIPIGRLFRKLKRKKFRQRAKQLVKRIQWRGKSPEPSYRQAATATMQAALTKLSATLLGDVPTEETLHALRISGKRLRYALELFPGAFTTTLVKEEVYPLVETMQNLLGEVNDRVSAVQRIESWLEQCNAASVVGELQQLLHAESSSLEAALAAFERWWQAGEAMRLCSGLKRLAADDPL